jgi:hypothetical protein
MKMDNFLLMILLWAGTSLVCALLNMLISWTFSWSELVLQALAGAVIGVFFVLGTAPGADALAKFFLMFSTGFFGLLNWAGVAHFQDPLNLYLWTAIWSAAGVLIAGALDRATLAISPSQTVGGGVLSIPIVLLKAPTALVTSAICMLFVLVGSITAAARTATSVGFLGGVVYVEWDTPGNTSATTLGVVVNVWSGRMSQVIQHELYHSRQYMFMHDWLIPFWLLGGLWGWISAALASPAWNIRYFLAANHACEVGNPLERAAYRADGRSPF